MTSSCVSGRLPLGFAQVLPLWVCWHNFSSMLHVCTLLFSPAHTPDFCFHSIPCLSLSSSNHFAHPFGGLHAYLCCHFPISFCSSSVLNQPGVTVSTMERLGRVTGVHWIISQFQRSERTIPDAVYQQETRTSNFIVLDEKPRCKTSLKKQNLNELPVLHIGCRAVV